MRSSFNIIFTLAAIFIIAFGGVYYLYVFQPLREKTASLTADTQHRSERLVELEAATASFADLGEEIDKLSGAIADFEQKLPEQREVEIILKKIWELASRNSLVPKSVRTEPAENKGRFSNQSIQMTITGDFEGFYAFMLEIERLNRITRMPTIKIKKIENDIEGLMQADVVLQIFFEPNRARSKAQAKAKAQTKAQTKVQAKAQAQAQTKAQAQAKAKAQAHQTEAQAQAEAQAQTKTRASIHGRSIAGASS